MVAEFVPDATPAQQRVISVVLGVLKATARVSPVPTAVAVRKLFEQTGAVTAANLRRHAPVDVMVWPDEAYGEGDDEVADVYVPASSATAGTRLPTVVWAHGGGFVGGSKEELAGWFRLVADAGFCVVAPRYTLAPKGRHPTPVRQVMTLLAHLQKDPARLHVDPDRLVFAGDSAGAGIAAQSALVVTDPEYARLIGVAPTVKASQLRATVLCCGLYDVTSLDDPTSPFAPFVDAIMWAYAGKRAWRDDATFVSTLSLPGHVTAAFPPSFVTVGHADPLAPQTDVFAESLAAAGVVLEALRYATDHEPPLEHEYQFDLDLDDARSALAAITDFIHRHTAVLPT